MAIGIAALHMRICDKKLQMSQDKANGNKTEPSIAQSNKPHMGKPRFFPHPCLIHTNQL
jgi:hypothetical protein